MTNTTVEKIEMTPFQKFMLKEIKAHNESRSDYLGKYNKGIKFVSMSIHPKHTHDLDCEGNTVTKYNVTCRFKPSEKWGVDMVDYRVVLYSDGTMGIYFEGERYE